MTSQWKNVSALPVPGSVMLTDVAAEVIASHNLVDKFGKYETTRLVLALKLKMGENGIIHLLGFGCRAWDTPSLPWQEAMSTVSYKNFQLDFAHSTSAGTMPGRFSALSEMVSVSITYLQKQMIDGEGKEAWCNFILSLPPKYDSSKLPDWFSEKYLDAVLKDIKRSRQLVNISQNDRESDSVPDLPKLHEKSKHPEEIEDVVKQLKMMELKESKARSNTSGMESNDICGEELVVNKPEMGHELNSKNYLDICGEELVVNRPEMGHEMRNSKTLGARKKTFPTREDNDILSHTVPSMPSQVLLMPRHVTPPRQPHTTPQFSAQPYQYQQISDYPGWKKHQIQEPLQEKWHDATKLQDQMKERVKFAGLQDNIGRAINNGTSIIRENQYEEINEQLPPTSKPLYHFEMPSKYEPNRSSTPVGFGFVRETERNEMMTNTERTQDKSWSGLSFLGPRFPSLSPNSDDNNSPRIEERRTVENLRQITEDELRKITNLEGEIHENIYGSRQNQAPCSLLQNHQVVAASQYPSLLPGTLKQRIKLMHQVLEMMDKTKRARFDTLRHLQERGAQQPREALEHGNANNDGWNHLEVDEQEKRRTSNRLAGKSKLDYNQLHKHGY